MSIVSVTQKTELPVKPEVGNELLGITEDCLVVQSFNVNTGIAMGWGGTWLFWLMGLPAFLFFVIAPWLPPYGYRDGVEIIGFYEKISGLSFTAFIIYFLFYVLLLGGTALGITLGFAYIHLRRMSKSFSPISFNRTTQTISTLVDGEIEELPWFRVSGTIRSHRFISGYVLHSADILFINNLGKMTAMEGLGVGEWIKDEYHSGSETLWEFIRHFMENGPEQLNIPASNGPGLNNLDKQLMYSYNFKESLESNWPWPIVRSKNKHWMVILLNTLFFWPARVVFFFHNVLADWLWRKMCLRMLKNSKSTPKYYFDSCAEKIITPKDVEEVITEEEASNGGTLLYSEVKRRLQSLK